MSGGPLMKQDKNGIWSLIAVLRGSHTIDFVEKPCDQNEKEVKYDDFQLLVPLLKEIKDAIKN